MRAAGWAGLLWCAVALAAAALVPVPHWRVLAGAGVAGGLSLLLGGRAPQLGRALLAIGAAPLWLVLGATAEAGRLALAALGLALVARCWRRGGQGSALDRAPALIAVLTVVEVLRQASLGGSLSTAVPLALPLLCAGLAVAGAATAPPGRPPAAALLLAAAVLVGRAASIVLPAPATVQQAAAVARSGFGERWLERLSLDRRLGLAALRADPLWHTLAERLEPLTGAAVLLDAGWIPDEATMDAALRIKVADALQMRGEGTRALRLLRRDRADPRVGWAWALLARRLGQEPSGLDALTPPADTPTLPGAIQVNWTFLTNGESHVDIAATATIHTLRWQVHADAYQGSPKLDLLVDGQARGALLPEDGDSELHQTVNISPGPHRIALRYVNDLADETGDRNAWVLELRAD